MRARLRRIGEGLAAPLIVLLGAGLLAGIARVYLGGSPTLVPVLVAGIPSVVLVVGGAWLLAGDIDRQSHPTILGYALGGALVLVAIVGGSQSIVSLNPIQSVPRLALLFMTGVGGVSGYLTGAEAVRRAREARRAEQAETTASLLAEERARLEMLSETMRALVRAESVERVAHALVRRGRTGLPGAFVGIWLYDENRDRLEHVESGGTKPEWRASHLRAGTPAMEAFLSGETQSIESSRGLPDLPTLVAVPLGTHGLLVVGDRHSFDDRQHHLVEVYGQSTRTALDVAVRERALRDQREFTDALLNSIQDIFFAIDDRGRPLRWNDRLLSVTGYTEHDLEDMRPLDVVAPEDHETVLSALDDLATEGTVEGLEIDLVTRGGERIPYEVTARRIDVPDEDVAGIAGTARDITERKERERELERQNERLEAFASVLAHDLRNPLNVVSGSIELAIETGNERQMQRVADAADRMARIVDDVLELARGGEEVVDRDPVSIDRAVAAAWDAVAAPDATLETGDLPTVQGDRDRIQRLFENLFRNAVEHAGPDVRVSVGSLDYGGPSVEQGAGPPGFFVADDGPGIPPEERDRIFEEGYSGSGGTGLGLAIVDQIASAHGWNVAVTESADGGARFEFRPSPR